MGSCLLIEILAAIGEDADLDFDAGLDALRESRAAILQDVGEAGWVNPDWTDEEVLDHLFQAMKDVEVAITGGHPEVVSYQFGAYSAWITGGPSWGDSPSRIYDAFERVSSSKTLHRAIGFEWPGKAVSCARENHPGRDVLEHLSTGVEIVDLFISNLHAANTPEVRIIIQEV